MTTLELAQKLVSFPTHHKNPEAMQSCLDFCVDYLKGYNLFVTRYEHEGIRSVVIQTKQTLEPDVLILGHIDVITAPDELFVTRVEKGRLYGLGSLDMKAFVATSMKAFKDLLDSGYVGNIALAIVTDEELGGHSGANYLVNAIGYRPKLVLVPDDGGHINNLVVESKHIMHIRFNAKGVYAHGCEPWLGQNAITALLETYGKLEKTFLRATAEDPHLSTVNLGTITGGVATNEVPAEASMTVDIRFPGLVKRDWVLSEIKNALSPGVEYVIEVEGYPTGIDLDHKALRMYADAMQQVTGESPQYIKSGGGTDGRFFAQHEIPVITHQGGGGNCQAADEYVDIESLDKLVEIYKLFIPKFTTTV